MFDIVVAADLDRGIGKDHGLPWPKLRGDLRHFKKTTSTASAGKRNAIVMGRKTWESKEVGCSPLPNRLNVVVRHGALERLARPSARQAPARRPRTPRRSRAPTRRPCRLRPCLTEPPALSPSTSLLTTLPVSSGVYSKSRWSASAICTKKCARRHGWLCLSGRGLEQALAAADVGERHETSLGVAVSRHVLPDGRTGLDLAVGARLVVAAGADITDAFIKDSNAKARPKVGQK